MIVGSVELERKIIFIYMYLKSKNKNVTIRQQLVFILFPSHLTRQSLKLRSMSHDTSSAPTMDAAEALYVWSP